MDKYIYLYLLFSYELILLCVAWRKFNHIFFSPSFYTLFTFLVSTALNIYCIDYWDITFYPITFIVISIGLTTMVIAEYCVCSHIHHRGNMKLSYICIPDSLKISLSVYCIIATFLYYNEIRNIGLTDNMEIGAAIANVKADFSYYEDQFNPIIRQGYKMVMAIAYIFTYIFVNNFHVCKRPFKKVFWFIIPIFCGVAVNLLSASRGDMLRLLILYLFIYYIALWQKSGWTSQPIKRIIKMASPLIIGMLSVFVAARQFVKQNVDVQLNIGGPIEYLAYYIGSPIQVFNLHLHDIYSNIHANDGATFGRNTFGGIYDLLTKYNIMDKHDIVSTKVGTGFKYIGGDAKTDGNVDTIMAFAHVDFGLIGMVIYLFLIYYITSKYFYRNIVFRPMTIDYVRKFLFFSFFFYEITMSFYSDVMYQIISQTGILQFICLYLLIHFIIKPKFFYYYRN